mgnify:CR=1 FL=1
MIHDKLCKKCKISIIFTSYLPENNISKIVGRKNLFYTKNKYSYDNKYVFNNSILKIGKEDHLNVSGITSFNYINMW